MNLIQESNTDSGIDESYIQPECVLGALLDDSQNSQTLDLLGLSLNIDTKSIKTMATGIFKKAYLVIHSLDIFIDNLMYKVE